MINFKHSFFFFLSTEKSALSSQSVGLSLHVKLHIHLSLKGIIWATCWESVVEWRCPLEIRKKPEYNCRAWNRVFAALCISAAMKLQGGADRGGNEALTQTDYQCSKWQLFSLSLGGDIMSTLSNDRSSSRTQKRVALRYCNPHLVCSSEPYLMLTC